MTPKRSLRSRAARSCCGVIWRRGCPASAEYETPGTLWIAADEEEMAEAARKQAYYAERGVPARILSASDLAALEPNLRPGLAGALLVAEDAVVYPPAVALHLAREAEARGATLIIGRSVTKMGHGEAVLDDGTRLAAPRLINAMGAWSPQMDAEIPVRKRKGHLVITDRYPGYVRHQLVELGYSEKRALAGLGFGRLQRAAAQDRPNPHRLVATIRQ